MGGFQDFLRGKRLDAGLSCRVLAIELGVDPVWLNEIEKERTDAPDWLIEAISGFLGLSGADTERMRRLAENRRPYAYPKPKA